MVRESEIICLYKKYQTRCGYPARIYAVEHNEVHAAYQYASGVWKLSKYHLDGRITPQEEWGCDLIEVVNDGE